VLNFSRAQRPLLLLPIGAVYFGLYYTVFRVCIVRWNLATPGRDAEDLDAAPIVPMTAATRAKAFVMALGGAGNLAEVAACTTRLRLTLMDNKAIDEAALKRLGARGLLRSATQGLQVVLGPIADQVAGEMREVLRAGVPAEAKPATEAAPIAAPDDASRDAPHILAALGGRNNVLDVEALAGRLLIRTGRPEIIDEAALATLGVRGVARTGGASIQLLVSGSALGWVQPLRQLLAAA
jgi:N-acetylglucosamine PTS system EIICBA or EIICB component